MRIGVIKVFSAVAVSGYVSCNTVVCNDDLLAKTTKKSYKYVVVGAGPAGQAAIEVFTRARVIKDVLWIDPNHSTESLASSSAQMSCDTILGIDCIQRTLITNLGAVISYDKCLLAIGLQPLDASTLLDSAILDPSLLNKTPNRMLPKSIILDPRSEIVQSQLINILEKGGHVTVVGAFSYENLSLCCRLASIAKEQFGYNNSVTLVYPGYGPMSSILPRFLSLSLASKMINSGVELLPYSYIRYITSSDSHSSKKDDSDCSLDIYVAKTYDSLTTSHFPTDALIFFPNSSFNHQSHIKCLGGIVEVDRLSGGLVVDSNMCLGQGQSLYAAGQCSTVYRPIHGSTSNSWITGERIPIRGERESYITGEVAAHAMLGKEYDCRKELSSFRIQIIDPLYCDKVMVMAGICSAALESHSFVIKSNKNEVMSDSSSKGSSPESLVNNKKNLSNLTTYVESAMKGFGGSNTSSTKSTESSYKTLGKLGVNTVDNSIIYPSESVGNKMNRAATGGSITFYLEGRKVVGVLVTGIQRSALYGNNDSMNHEAVARFEGVLEKFVGLDLTSIGSVSSKEISRLTLIKVVEEYATLLIQQLNIFEVKDIKKLHKYNVPSRTAISDITEHLTKSPPYASMYLQEPILQKHQGHMNSGSRATRVAEAYSHNISSAVQSSHYK